MHMDTVKKKVWVFTDTILYVHADAGIADLPDDPGAFSAVSHSISIDMTWPVVDGVAPYEVNYSIGPKNAARKTTSVSGTTGLEHSIRNLTPDTEYSVYLYDTEEGLLLFSGTYKTLLNVVANHSKSAYAADKGFDASYEGFDLSKLDARSFRNLDGVMNELFATGDSSSLNVSPMPMQAKFVKRGGSTSVERGGVLAILFSATSGSGQSVTLRQVHPADHCRRSNIRNRRFVQSQRTK
ncbi:unnamed protein product, partial [Laminaria digitata]